MQIILTMTCWKGRINILGRSIYNFITRQTVKPDIVYVWLAEEEFPNKELDLPTDLLLVCNHFNIKIKWIKDNEYCFKRWYIYPKHYNDFVISIDEDQCYKPNTIELSLKYMEKFPNTIFCLADLFYSRQYNNSFHNECLNFSSNEPDYRYCFCGQCVIPPGCFPLNAWTEETINVRKKICKKCDESWFNPWLVKNGIKCYCIKELNPMEYHNTQENGLWHEMNYGDKFNTRDYQLLAVLQHYPELMNIWKKVFPTYII